VNFVSLMEFVGFPAYALKMSSRVIHFLGDLRAVLPDQTVVRLLNCSRTGLGCLQSERVNIQNSLETLHLLEF
jgi:hypothetical protein